MTTIARSTAAAPAAPAGSAPAAAEPALSENAPSAVLPSVKTGVPKLVNLAAAAHCREPSCRQFAHYIGQVLE